jgi:hypothetical protein
MVNTGWRRLGSAGRCPDVKQGSASEAAGIFHERL